MEAAAFAAAFFLTDMSKQGMIVENPEIPAARVHRFFTIGGYDEGKIQKGDTPMDEMENQVLPTEPVNQEEPVTEEAPPAAEREEPVAEEQPIPEPAPQRPSRRRSPYENSPYLMPIPQTFAAEEAPKKEKPQEPAAAEPPKAELPKSAKRRIWIAAALMILAVTLLVYTVASITADHWQKRTEMRIQSLEEQIGVLRDQLEAVQNSGGDSVSGTPNVTPDGSLTPGQVYARNLQSVVLIETDVATGSGFILTEDGYVVTNYHVVEDGSVISVVLDDRTAHRATLVGYEANNDVALLKIEGENFQPVKLGSSDALIVGDQVVAIGNPLGELTSTLTVGYVSAKERDVSTDSTVINMLQTDCAINSGNSGGPLFNMKGEVVGITTAKYSGMSSAGASIEGIGIAVPMDDVAGALEDLMEFGYVRSGYLGVMVYGMDPNEAERFDLPMGCLVDSVTRGSCADIAGVKPKDIITGLGGWEIEGLTDLTRVLRKYNGGETTTITVYRGGQTLVLSITLDEKPHEDVTPRPDTNPMPENGTYEEWFEYFFGE